MNGLAVIIVVALTLTSCSPNRPPIEATRLQNEWTAFAVGMISGDDFNAAEPWTRKLWLELERAGLKPVRVTTGSDELIGTRQPPLVEPYVLIQSVRPGRPGCMSSTVSSRRAGPRLPAIEVHTRLTGFRTGDDGDRCIREHVANIKAKMVQHGY